MSFLSALFPRTKETHRTFLEQRWGFLKYPKDMQNEIFKLLSFKDLIAVSSTCKSLRENTDLLKRVNEDFGFSNDCSLSWKKIQNCFHKIVFPTNFAVSNLKKLASLPVFNQENLCRFTLQCNTHRSGLISQDLSPAVYPITIILEKTDNSMPFQFYWMSIVCAASVPNKELIDKVLKLTSALFNIYFANNHSKKPTAIQREYFFHCNGCQPHGIFKKNTYLKALKQIQPPEKTACSPSLISRLGRLFNS